MTQFLGDYGLFLAELVTLAVIVVLVAATIVGIAKRSAPGESLNVEHLNERYETMGDAVRRIVEGRDRFKQSAKLRRKEHKRLHKKGSDRNRMFVIDFKGDIRASATASLREEVSAILAAARPEDQVLVRLENPGGTVHEHGLAASQLLRIKQHGLRLLVAVDKVAASGGYLMACVADEVLAAPFAIVGSIGVIAQLPNFHRWLESKGVDFEQVMAGRYKRTLTLFGENTDEGRDKLKEELEEIHRLFKHQIAEHRPQVDLDLVSTGEHWYGIKALELGLIDRISTSDDFLLESAKSFDLYGVSYKRRRSVPERLMAGAESLLSR